MTVSRPRTKPRTAVRRLALGRVISMTGTFAAGTALTYTIYERTHSTAWVSATMLLTCAVIGFLGPLAGAIGDRFDRRRVMILGESAAAVCWVAIAFVTHSPTVMLSIAFVSSVLEAPFFPASSAAIPNVAGEENITWANSLLAIGRYTGITLGPVVGGLLVSTVGPEWVFVANAISYAVSVALVWSVRADFSDRDVTEKETEEHRGVLAGFRFVARDRVLRQVALSFGVFLIGMAGTLVADPVLAEEFGAGSFGYGLLTALWGGGTIVGAYFGRRVTEDTEVRWLLGSSALVAITGFGVALSPWFGLVLVWVFIFGLTDGPTLVVEQNLLQRRTPDVVRGRVMGAWDTFMHGSLVVALMLGGVVVHALGPKGAYAVGGVMGVVATLLLLPLFRWLPDRARDVGTVEAAEVSELVPFDPSD